MRLKQNSAYIIHNKIPTAYININAFGILLCNTEEHSPLKLNYTEIIKSTN